MIDIEKFICSLIHRSSGFCVIKVVDIIDALHHQGLDYKDGNIIRLSPESKESENERVRKRLLSSFKDIMADADEDELWYGLSYKDIIAWLEKQGEHANFLNKIQIGDKVTRNKDGMLVNLSQLNRVAKKYEKQGEQKPAEYEKPLLEKFKQAVYDCAWGKVTCKKEGETKEEYAERWAEQFLLMVRDWADDYIDLTIQQKLRNSYEKGNIDYISGIRKELLNIENNAENIVGLTESQWVAIRAAHRLLGEYVAKKQKPTWKPSDEQMHYLSWIANIKLGDSVVEQEVSKHLNELYNDLKKLKEE